MRGYPKRLCKRWITWHINQVALRIDIEGISLLKNAK
ncbi:hypothetical protein XHC_2172 [Xanthomonas hortorum pv. carotae str. M081]|nr:hypothetical protein XHC_2172 [Xanthomonas hortorum pv. carotae str. M081]